MSIKNKIIPSKLKSQILSELSKPESKISEISKLYGVSRATLYKWNGENDTYCEGKNFETAEAASNGNFIELTVKDAVNVNLKSASLQFNDFSLLLEGKISSDLLMALVKTVEFK